MESMEKMKEYLDDSIIHSPSWMRKYGTDEPMGRVGLICSFYFRGAHLPEVQAKACECLREYVQIVGEEARSSEIDGHFSRAGKKELPVLTEEKIAEFQSNNEYHVDCVISSADSHLDMGRTPSTSMFWLTLLLDHMFTPEGIPFDKQISTLWVCFRPSLFLLQTQPISFVELICKWCEALNPVHGTAGLGIVRAIDLFEGVRFWSILAPYLLEYPGLELLPSFIRAPVYTENIVDINWLTILNDELAERVGGQAALNSLGEDCPVAQYPGGAIIQAGPEPVIGNRDKGEIPKAYGKVQKLLMPLYPPVEKMFHISGGALPYSIGVEPSPAGTYPEKEVKRRYRDFYRQWLNRFE